MQRAVAHYPPPQMAVLGAVEFTLSFAVIYAVIQSAGASMALPAIVDVLPRGDMVRAAILTLTIGSIALTIGLYRPEVCRNRKRLLIATGLTAIITFAVLLFVDGGSRNGLTGFNTLCMAEVLGAWLATLTLIRVAHGFAVSRAAMARRILLLGAPRQIGAVSVRLRSGRGRLFDPVMLRGRPVSWQVLREQAIWHVVIASEPGAQAVQSLLDCKLRGARILSGAAFNEKYLGRIDLDVLTATDLLLGQGFAASRMSAVLKRICDIAIGSCLLVLTLPLMAVTAMAIKLDSPGLVLYRQQRTGQFDTTFTLLKFRSMAANAEGSGSPLWAQKHDPRITRIGRFIRATRIDELPQLANVIRGEMSLVGPRPERPHFVEQLTRAIPFYRQRAYVKPGLTGWAQVNFPYGASVEDAREKLAYDLYYVKNRTIMLDLIILISTVRVVLFREGAR
jgi:exopolysaccharide biosynthesis polyprenyl glycosylphosphotransferase